MGEASYQKNGDDGDGHGGTKQGSCAESIKTNFSSMLIGYHGRISSLSTPFRMDKPQRSRQAAIMGEPWPWRDGLRATILEGIPTDVPPPMDLDPTVDHAPDRPVTVNTRTTVGT